MLNNMNFNMIYIYIYIITLFRSIKNILGIYWANLFLWVVYKFNVKKCYFELQLQKKITVGQAPRGQDSELVILEAT